MRVLCAQYFVQGTFSIPYFNTEVCGAARRDVGVFFFFFFELCVLCVCRECSVWRLVSLALL